jgi:predicted  nucleic acid-binding Zn-ribbon protein
MNSQLEALIALQDLDLLIREASDPAQAGHEASLGFTLDNVEQLQQTRARLTRQIDQKLLQAYDRISRRFVRAVVPVDGAICLGCFMALPTGAVRRHADAATIENCENCGRILYRI